MRRRLHLWLLAGYWLLHLLVFHLPIQPQPRAVLGRHSDKWLHVAAYAVLAWLVARAVDSRRLARRGGFGWLVLWLALAAYAAVDEWTQPLTNRYADFNDWLADAAGAAIGLATAWLARRKLSRRD